MHRLFEFLVRYPEHKPGLGDADIADEVVWAVSRVRARPHCTSGLTAQCGARFGGNTGAIAGETDATAAEPPDIWVFELKTGARDVLPEGNAQLMLYALGVAEHYRFLCRQGDHVKPFKTVHLVVLQRKEEREHVMPAADLLSWADVVKPQVMRAFKAACSWRAEDRLATPSAGACFICPDRGCPSRWESSAVDDFEAVPDELTLEDILS